MARTRKPPVRRALAVGGNYDTVPTIVWTGTHPPASAPTVTFSSEPYINMIDGKLYLGLKRIEDPT